MCLALPKWVHHRRIAKRVSISLPEKAKKAIDSRLDGFDEDYVHDPWKIDVSGLREVVEWAVDTYGPEGVKYCFLHMVLDTAQERAVSEGTKETLGARMMRSYAHEIAFQDSYLHIGIIVKEYLSEYYHLWKQMEPELMRLQGELAGEVGRLPEVRSQVENVERLKRMNEMAERLVSRYPRCRGFDKVLYMNFVKRLWRGDIPKNEWAMRVLEEFRQMLRGRREDDREAIYSDLMDVARRLGYISDSSTSH